MTPQEKALQLCQSFGKSTLFDEEGFNEGRTLPLRIVQKMAHIAVDEILNNGLLEPMIKRHLLNGVKPEPIHLEYWLQVKQEIEKL